MVKSMTGFGRSEKITEQYKITVEIKSVNHRYCDFSIKLPKKFNAYESSLRQIMKHYANRGKIDIYVNYENYTENEVFVKYHPDIAAGYVKALRQASEDFFLPQEMLGEGLLRYPEVITLEERQQDCESLYPALAAVLQEAGRQFAEAREAEGAVLQGDILEKLTHILQMIEQIELRSPCLQKEYQSKILSKVEELLGDTKIEESVLAAEMILYADKVCVDEETVRLRSHIANMKETLQKEGPVGRKLDFITQEMNREANTILSKANDREISQIAIDLKTEIEKIREQIQNIE